MLVIADGHDKFLVEEEEWPYDRLEDFPAEVLSFHSGIRTWFNKSPLLMGGADSVQMLVNEILDSYLYVSRKNKNIILYDTQVFKSQAEVQAIIDAPDSTAHGVPGLADKDLRGSPIQAFEFLRVGEEKGELLGIAQTMFDRAMGTPQPIRMPKTDTATEASILDRRNTARENRRAALLAEFQVRKATKIWQLLVQFQPDELAQIDPEAAEFAAASAEMAKGHYRFTLDVTSQSSALAVERSQWMDLLNLFAGLTPLMIETYGFPPNLPEIARRLLVRGFDEKAVEELLPILNQAAQKYGEMPVAPQAQEPMIGEGEGGSPEFSSPEAQAASESVESGRTAKRGIGPAFPSSFQRGVPAAGQQMGNAQAAS